jgi:hypothetical protein
MTGFETHAVHPLTEAQSAVLARCRDAAQPEVMQIVIEGDRFAPRRMRAAWEAVAEKEGVLRSRFATADGAVVRIVDGQAALPWAEHDWRAAGADAPDRVAAFLEADRRLPVHLEVGPLHRLVLLRLPADRAVLVWTVHGVLLDEPSAEALLGCVFAAYAGRSDDMRPQDAASAGPAAPTMTLPGEPVAAADRAVERALPVETTRQLVRLSQSLGVSMSTIFEAAWAAVLAGDGSDPARFHVLRTR